MTIDELGFLSPDIEGWRKKHRADNPAWFALADRINKIAQRLVVQTKVPDNHQQFLGFLLFLRGTSLFQGAIVLAERGMTLEGRILARSCLETQFFLGALKNKPEFVQDFVGDDIKRRLKMVKKLSAIPEEFSGVSAEHKEKFSKLVENMQNRTDIEIKELLIREAAILADAIHDYNTQYAGLSNDSTHPSIVSLNRYVKADKDGEGVGLHWGPDVPDVEDTVFNACASMLQLLIKVRLILGLPETDDDLLQCAKEYGNLTEQKITAVDAELHGIMQEIE